MFDLTAADRPRPVGTTALRIDHYVRTAEYVILLGPEGRGRNLASEAAALTLDYGFHITNLRAVWLKVLEHNAAGIRAYERAGFKPAGRLRRSGYWLGAECDEIIMDALPATSPALPRSRRQCAGPDTLAFRLIPHLFMSNIGIDASASSGTACSYSRVARSGVVMA